VITSDTGEVPADLYADTGIIRDSTMAPFTKHLTVRGIKLMGRDEISDSYMLKTAQVIKEMFPQTGSAIESTFQESVITNMYKRNTAIPMYAGDDNIIWGAGEEA